MTPAEEDYLRILLRLDEGVLLLNGRGEIDLANDAFLRWFGLRNDVVRQPFGSVVTESAIAELAAAVWTAPEPLSRGVVVEADGIRRHLSVRASRLGEGERRRVLLLFQDVTAQRTLDEVGTDVVANVSHELRTPVAILAGYIENLVDFPRMPHAEQVEIFGIMQEHANRLKTLLDDLLTLACFESRSEVLDLVEIDLRQFLRRLGKDWQAALARKGMAFIVEVADEVDRLRVDPFRFEQVMHNLFDNAFKYTPLEGQIRVRAARVGDQIEISVEDNGAGIPAADLPHIFDRFYRVDKGRSRKYGGAGLGLSIVRHIIALHGGTVRAESTLQMSTRVILSLPA